MSLVIYIVCNGCNKKIYMPEMCRDIKRLENELYFKRCWGFVGDKHYCNNCEVPK